MVALNEVTALIITRGDLPELMAEREAQYERLGIPLLIIESPDVLTRWTSAERFVDTPYVFFQDDDVALPDEQITAIIADRKPDRIVASMYDEWIQSMGYFDIALVGLGAVVPVGIWREAIARWTAAYPDAHEHLKWDADFIIGALTPWERKDYGGAEAILPEASADNRLWRQAGQHERKNESINMARALRTIVLTMLVKDEEKNIHRALSSARPLYDRVLIHDTGSTDHTEDVVSAFCEAENIPLRYVTDVPFEGFGAARNALMDDARGEADYMLLMDADEEFIFADEDEHPRPPLFCDAYNFHYEGPLDYAQPRLIYGNFPWHWTDVKSHSALDGPEGRTPIGCDMESPLIRHHGDDRASSVERYQRDVDNLTDDLRAQRDVPRSRFMRAKAYEGLFALTGRESYRMRAIIDYRSRVEMSQGDEESYYARFRLGCLLVESGKFASGADELFSAWLDRPTRVESLRALAAYATAVADATPYPVGDMIIVHRDLYH